MKTLLCSVALSFYLRKDSMRSLGLLLSPSLRKSMEAVQFLLNPQTTLSFKNCDVKDVSLFVEQLRKSNALS
jgi:hexosaminidase